VPREIPTDVVLGPRNRLTVSNAYLMFAWMHATIYGRGQMVIPAEARKQAGIDQGDVVSVEPDGDGRIVLIRLEKTRRAKAKVRIQYRQGTHAVATAGRAITSEQVRALLADFP
jgi:AbrB family looped-hinge helix DNA binding protein